MFTGIVSSTGLFKGFRQGRRVLLLEAPAVASRLSPGDSLSVNGVCLTAVEISKGTISFDLSRETLGKSNLGALRPGARLNLELPLTPTSLLGGHLVTGHIDGVGKVLRLTEKKPGKRLAVGFPREMRPFLIPKGSVAVNGVSLTVAAVGPSSLEVELIPTTLRESNLGDLRPGEAVNIECDMIGKYVYNWMVQGYKERERSGD